MAIAEERLLRLAQHLAWADIDGRVDQDCEVATQGGEGRCIERAVAIRWEQGFADRVCEQHALSAATRGAVVVYAKRQDGSDT